MRRHPAIAWTLWAAYWLVLLTLTHLPPRFIGHPPVTDKTLHVLAYTTLAGLLYVALWATWPRRPIVRWVLGCICVLGALDEWTQPMFGRSCELLDWVADVSGAIVAVGMLMLIRRIAERWAPAPPPPPVAAPSLSVPPWSHKGR